MILKRGVPVFIAVLFGLLALVGLLIPVPRLSNLILSWASFLAALALLLGVLNLMSVHASRLFRQRNLYSGVLFLSMITVFTLAVTDAPAIGLTQNGVATLFNWIQVPLEAALASLLAFFLLFAGFQLLKRQRNGWSALFLGTIILLLLSNALLVMNVLPPDATRLVGQARSAVQEVVVTAGMRGILIGVALGTITLSVRLLTGMERPYNR